MKNKKGDSVVGLGMVVPTVVPLPPSMWGMRVLVVVSPRQESHLFARILKLRFESIVKLEKECSNRHFIDIWIILPPVPNVRAQNLNGFGP